LHDVFKNVIDAMQFTEKQKELAAGTAGGIVLLKVEYPCSVTEVLKITKTATAMSV